jgi:hypothetical protein
MPVRGVVRLLYIAVDGMLDLVVFGPADGYLAGLSVGVAVGPVDEPIDEPPVGLSDGLPVAVVYATPRDIVRALDRASD